MNKSGGSLLITYSFGVVFTPISAGTRQITVWMESDYGRPAEFRSTAANLQCFEMVLPKPQS